MKKQEENKKKWKTLMEWKIAGRKKKEKRIKSKIERKKIEIMIECTMNGKQKKAKENKE